MDKLQVRPGKKNGKVGRRYGQSKRRSAVGGW
jgi:hypothetical protein